MSQRGLFYDQRRIDEERTDHVRACAKAGAAHEETLIEASGTHAQNPIRRFGSVVECDLEQARAVMEYEVGRCHKAETNGLASPIVPPNLGFCL